MMAGLTTLPMLGIVKIFDMIARWQHNWGTKLSNSR